MIQAPLRIGLVLARTFQVLREEPYYHELVEGLERVLTPAVRFLAGHGHTVLGHVSGPPTFTHTQLRRAGFAAEAADRGLTLLTVDGDYSQNSGRAVTAELLAARPVPATAIVYDNDVMALGGLESIRAHGLRVPADLSVVAWDDSAQCQLAAPALSAMSHDVSRIGELAAAALLDVMSGASTTNVYEAPRAHVVERDSTRRLADLAPA